MTAYTNQNLIEEDRINALRRYDILDTPPDNTFDKLTKLAAKLMKVPVAIIALVDKDRVWFKSKFGLKALQMEREKPLCHTVILTDNFYQIEDADIDLRTMDHKLVIDDFPIRFYAAYPLKTKDGYNLGAFCIIDRKPRSLNQEEQEILNDLRDIAVDQIELRLTSKLSAAQHNYILKTTAHDLKNPLTTIPVRADLIKLRKHDPEAVDNMCDQIKMASLNMVRIIDEVLQSGSMEAGEIRLLLVKLNIAQLVSSVVEMNRPLAERKGQHIYLDSDTDVFGYVDEGKLTEIVDNLITNAIKYSPLNTNIYIKVKNANDQVMIVVEDEGPGLTAGDKNGLFKRFTRLSAQPTAGEHSAGLGLSIVKILVEAHGGLIFAESEGKNKGTRFIVQLPVVLKSN